MNVIHNLTHNCKDHLMADAWRLILEGYRSRPVTIAATPLPTPDFSSLEKMRPEYRLIRLKIAAGYKNRPQ